MEHIHLTLCFLLKSCPSQAEQHEYPRCSPLLISTLLKCVKTVPLNTENLKVQESTFFLPSAKKKNQVYNKRPLQTKTVISCSVLTTITVFTNVLLRISQETRTQTTFK